MNDNNLPSFQRSSAEQISITKAVRSKLSGWQLSETTCFLLLISLIGYLAYGTFYAPLLYSDDWNHVVERIATPYAAQWFNLADRRPLLFAPFYIQYYIFGLNITAFYGVLWFVNAGIVYLVFKLANQFSLLRQHALGLVVALLFYIYPTNYTHTWLSMLFEYTATGLTLLYAYSLLKYTKEGRLWMLLLALTVLFISFGLYEGQLGVVCAWALFLFAFDPWLRGEQPVTRPARIKQRLLLLLPIGLAGVFAWWRTFAQLALGVHDVYLPQLTLTPTVLIARLILGFKVSLVWGWTTTIQYFTHGWLDNKLALLLLGGGLLLILGGIRLLLPNGAEQPLARWTLRLRRSELQRYAGLGVVGLGLIGAGYVPVITLFLPNLMGNGGSSRVNLFASLGGALVWTAICALGACLLAKTRQQIRTLFRAAAALLILLGVMTQAAVQFENRAAWREQQALWHALRTAAPSFRNDTFVLLILPGYQDRVGYQNWRRTPLHAFWDISSGLRVLYNNPTLAGDLFFPDTDPAVKPTLTTAGIKNYESGVVTPYTHTVAFIFDAQRGELQRLNKLPFTASPEGQNLAAVRFCPDCVLREGQTDTALRRLLEP